MSGRGQNKGRGDSVRLRRLLTLGLALGLGIFGLEIAIHSAHHLSDQDARAHCNIAAASTHVVATGGGSSAVKCPPMSVGEAQADADVAQVMVPTLRANQERAPPVACS
jgi:hypothetical protein